MKTVALNRRLAALVCVAGTGCVAGPPTARIPTGESDSVQTLTTLTCAATQVLWRAGDMLTGGLAILWLDGYYSGRSGLTELPAGWTRTVARGCRLARSPWMSTAVSPT